MHAPSFVHVAICSLHFHQLTLNIDEPAGISSCIDDDDLTAATSVKHVGGIGCLDISTNSSNFVTITIWVD